MSETRPHHLRFAGQPEPVQRAALEAMIRAEPVLMAVLDAIRAEGLPEGLLVSGALYNHAWNVLTGRPALHGVKDIDIAYFDRSDLSYEAEDRVIQAFGRRLAGLNVPVEVRNQARVHLWFPERFGQAYAPLGSAAEALTRYASKTHAVAARLEADGSMTIIAPFGLEPIFAFRVVPNRVLDNEPAHAAKGARARAAWPEVTVEPW